MKRADQSAPNIEEKLFLIEVKIMQTEIHILYS